MDKNSYQIKLIKMSGKEEYFFQKNQQYSILFIVRGTAAFTLGDKKAACSTEDIIIIKPGIRIKMNYYSDKYPLEILSLSVKADTLRELSDEHTDFEEAFNIVPFNSTVIHCESTSSMLIKSVAKKLLAMPGDASSFAHDIYEKNLLSMLLVLLLRSCIDVDKQTRDKKRKNVVMDDIFLYIKEHLTEDISLERLEKEFFISRYHIVREFKKLTGQTPHAYIVKSRLDLCRKYIEQGKPIREVYNLGGFGGYNHFFRAFKKEYGITPMEYYKDLQIEKTIKDNDN